MSVIDERIFAQEAWICSAFGMPDDMLCRHGEVRTNLRRNVHTLVMASVRTTLPPRIKPVQRKPYALALRVMPYTSDAVY
jgi:hypothetical protein